MVNVLDKKKQASKQSQTNNMHINLMARVEFHMRYIVLVG